MPRPESPQSHELAAPLSSEGALLSECQRGITCVTLDDRLLGVDLSSASSQLCHSLTMLPCARYAVATCKARVRNGEEFPGEKQHATQRHSGEAPGSLRQRERGTVDKRLYRGFFRKVRETQNKRL